MQIFRYQKRIKKKTIREILILSLETFQWAFNGAETQGGNGGKCPKKKSTREGNGRNHNKITGGRGKMASIPEDGGRRERYAETHADGAKYKN